MLQINKIYTFFSDYIIYFTLLNVFMKSQLHSDIKRVFGIFLKVKYAGSIPAKLAVARYYSLQRDFMSLTCNTRPGESKTRLASYTDHNTRHSAQVLAAASSPVQVLFCKNVIFHSFHLQSPCNQL